MWVIEALGVWERRFDGTAWEAAGRRLLLKSRAIQRLYSLLGARC
jgi:hypothetical protein